MQCFRVGYRGICHASLVFSVYTRAFRRVCIWRKYKWQVAYFTVSHEKALHNYFIPCLNLWKIYGNFGKGSEISANFRKFRKRLKPVFWETLKTIYETFGKLRKQFKSVFLGPVVQSPISANPGLTLNKTYGVNPGLALSGFEQPGPDVLWFFKIFGKSSENFRSAR